MPPASVPASDGCSVRDQLAVRRQAGQVVVGRGRVLGAEPFAEPLRDLGAVLGAVLEDVRGGAGHARVVAAHAEPGDLGDRDGLRLAADPARELRDVAEPEPRAPATQREGDGEAEQDVDHEGHRQEHADRLPLAERDPEDVRVDDRDQVGAGQVGVDLADDEPEQQDRERAHEPAPRRAPGARADVPAQAARDLPDGAQAGAGAGGGRRTGGRSLGRSRRHTRRPLAAPEPHSEPSTHAVESASGASRLRSHASRAHGRSPWTSRSAAAAGPSGSTRRASDRSQSASSDTDTPSACRSAALSSSSPTRDAGSSPSSASLASSSPNTRPPRAASSFAAPIGSIPGAPRASAAPRAAAGTARPADPPARR